MTKEEIKREITKRDQDNAKRYNKLYGIDYENDLRERADIVVKNDGLLEEVFEGLYKPLVAWLKEKRFVK